MASNTYFACIFQVHDVSFAHIEHQILLACIDEQGNFYVHDIELTDSGLRCVFTLAPVKQQMKIYSGV